AILALPPSLRPSYFVLRTFSSASSASSAVQYSSSSRGVKKIARNRAASKRRPFCIGKIGGHSATARHSVELPHEVHHEAFHISRTVVRCYAAGERRRAAQAGRRPQDLGQGAPQRVHRSDPHAQGLVLR